MQWTYQLLLKYKKIGHKNLIWKGYLMIFTKSTKKLIILWNFDNLWMQAFEKMYEKLTRFILATLSFLINWASSNNNLHVAYLQSSTIKTVQQSTMWLYLLGLAIVVNGILRPTPFRGLHSQYMVRHFRCP